MSNPNSNASPIIPLEWLYETLEKRMLPPLNLPLQELFLIVPWFDEAEFTFDIPLTPYIKKHYRTIYEVLAKQNKKEIRVFFVKPHRLHTPLLCWAGKFKYPKVGNNSDSLVLSYATLLDFQRKLERAHEIERGLN